LQRRFILLGMAVLVVALGVMGLRLGRPTPTEAAAERVAAKDLTAYTLPAGKLEKAIVLERTRMRMTVVGTVWSLAELVLILWAGAVARLRDFAVSVAKNRWAQGSVFVLGFLLLIALLNLPLGIYGHTVALRYGLSVQGWASWLGDKAKLIGLEWLVGTLLVMLMFWIIRKSPTRWWFWFWIPAVVSVVAGVFVSPYVIDPIFNQFEPLSRSDPALVQQLERVVARGGMGIPPERMFLMKASAKSTELNAYVTGFGASKRVVVWDTSVAKSTPDEISFMFAHEMGHYALGHVVLGTAISCVGLLPFFWVGYHGVRWLLRKYGAAWGIPSQGDWGALVVLVLVLMTAATLTEPLDNAISRTMEHDADVYGQEAVHGIVADPQTLGRQMFQVLGEDSLDDPTPHPVFEWWFDSHPATEFRAAFAQAYDPWAAGKKPKYFAKP
jgi:Zn-dependent protease with chaperone function